MREHMRAKRTRSETEIVAYLRAGHLLAPVMEWSLDLFDGTPFDGGAGSASLLTDGAWLWRQDLAHYVERYHVELPDDFVRSMADVRFRMPELTASEVAALAVAGPATGGDDWWATP
jgi:hypothetical protein